mmetsp:Transcript_9344/g.15642  ORF Transcript_9344/g.15642 Transcript_9344/m.15642 type:complete len:179 (-) Transcript_9344:13-549(-)
MNIVCILVLTMSCLFFGPSHCHVYMCRSHKDILKRPLLQQRRHCANSRATFLQFRGGGTDQVAQITKQITESKKLCWVALSFAILSDIGSTSLSKISAETSNKMAMALSVFLFNLSWAGFTISLSQIDLGVAFAVWAALGTAVVSFVGMAVFGERISTAKVLSILAILGGVTVLNLSD